MTFVQESLLILVVRHMSDTCPGWILGINESVNVKGNLIFTKMHPLCRNSKQVSLMAKPVFSLPQHVIEVI